MNKINKHITIASLLFLAGLFILPITAFAQGGATGGCSDVITAVSAPQTQVPPHTLTAENISRIEALQEKLQEENASTLKQLMNNAQKEITANIQDEINDLSAKLTLKRVTLYTELIKIIPDA